MQPDPTTTAPATDVAHDPTTAAAPVATQAPAATPATDPTAPAPAADPATTAPNPAPASVLHDDWPAVVAALEQLEGDALAAARHYAKQFITNAKSLVA